MYLYVPKVVRSPRYDHGHDEQSQNGRDIKIDILDDYVRTPEVFREGSGIYRSTGGLPEPPGEVLGLSGLEGRERRGGQGRPHAPSPSSPNWTRRGPFPSPSLLLPSVLLLLLEGLESYS